MTPILPPASFAAYLPRFRRLGTPTLALSSKELVDDPDPGSYEVLPVLRGQDGRSLFVGLVVEPADETRLVEKLYGLESHGPTLVDGRTLVESEGDELLDA
jgi:hypothetical protein